MAPTAEGDVLGELYAWDTTVEDDFALPADDPRRDEDKTEDAYEQMIHTASGDASDNVLSLAAQLLVKHFFRFPHVQLNVVDVLLKLCGPARSQAVRIHTLRSLLQIVKTPPATAAASTPTSAAAVARKNTKAWLQRIDQAVQKLLEMEKSSVILRQVTPLRHALDERLEMQQDPEQKQAKLTRSLNDSNSDNVSPTENSRKQTRDEKEATDGAESGYHTPSEREFKKVKRNDEQSRYQNDAKSNGNIVNLGQQEESNGDATNRGNGNEESWKKQPQLPPSSTNGRVVENESRRRGSNNTPNTFSPRNCPPCPYLFLGSVPRHTPNDEIVEFLSPVYPDIEATSVQIKQPDYNATAYAFVSLPSADKAREAIRYVAANKFRGRVFLNANFARGPPVDTLLFVERTGEGLSMEDEGAVRDFDFTQCDPDVWDILCQQLERFGPLIYAEKGCVRFRSVDHAKSVIRKQHFNVKGYEIYPVYDTKEQFAIDSTRRGLNVHKQSFTLKSGRLVGGDAEYRGSKGRYKDEDEPMEGDPSGRRESERMMSQKYRERSGIAKIVQLEADPLMIALLSRRSVRAMLTSVPSLKLPAMSNRIGNVSSNSSSTNIRVAVNFVIQI
ncbi:hypothetical protein BBO99_00003702 [Phytophthora kernoviae]|uniref:RRM domain-containing protein n=2 Tax=Phytophthora kernoviae TaxID=325452 RepID=A0A3R7KKZ7_9STRA|nr:hypothetical protein G195_005230 [Phytophthora kernoviae 00238/432]KAG2523873.1 hypothetical protein JM16_003207 [Phytophthora kernoviae]KAG2525699.1 hypothetical protein JM18_003077 [Phytophthora kernoviae]RLN02581.1 hypothetical protein BBI17_003426 [Phytophthora kernoviae]RLN81457.1 hypothetical protein BBO99_00003702 [Phytophthora kernoviae]